MRVVGIVQARMTSTRLPGKVLKIVLGKPLLQYELERLKKVPLLDDLIVATTRNATDDPVVDLCETLSIPTYRGSEFDVLSRYYEAATMYNADIVVRFTADCPLIDPSLANEVIDYFLQNEVDYCGLDVTSGYPRGMDTEVCSMQSLREAYMEADNKPEREHVTYFIWNRPQRYRVWRKSNEKNWSQYRLTVDTPEDFSLIKEIIERLYPCNENFTLADIVGLMETHPELAMINKSVEQKKI